MKKTHNMIHSPRSPWLWKHGLVYQLVIAGQVAFYSLVILGFVLERTRPKSWKIPALAYYFFMVNAAALMAIVNNIRGRHVLLWTPSREPESEKSSPQA